MKASNNIAIIILLSAFSLNFTIAIEVYTAGRNGKPSWHESSEMRDRSVVPRPSFQDKIADYRRRNKIPVPIATNYRSRSDVIPRPSLKDVVEDYRRRSGIPMPEKSSQADTKLPIRRAASRNYASNQKKSLINRILFSLPMGAQFPIYFSSRSRKGTNKKSNVAVPATRYSTPYRSQTWGLPINYRALENKRYLMPFIEQQAIARQRIMPIEGITSQSRNQGYYIPRSYLTSRLFSNRNRIPLIQRNRPYIVPSSRYFLNRVARSKMAVKKLKAKDVEQSRKAVINKDQRMRMDDELNNANTIYNKEEPISKDIENVITKLLFMI